MVDDTHPDPIDNSPEQDTPDPPTHFDLSRFKIDSPDGVGEVFYIPDFVTRDEEAYLLRQVSQSIMIYSTFVSVGGIFGLFATLPYSYLC